MTEVQRLKSELAEKRSAYATATETRESNVLLSEVTELEIALRKATADEQREAEASLDGEQREAAAIASECRLSAYVAAAVDQRAVDGREAEHNASLGIGTRQLPLSMLAPEVRATTNAESSVMQGTWLDRLFAGTAAQRVGITMRSVPAGVTSLPVTTAGPTPSQRARGQAIADGNFTVGVTELKPKRAGVRLTVSIEDTARLPSLEEALRRDLRASLVQYLDAVMFLGDSTADGNTADITGLQTAGIGESTLTQAHKVQPAQWMSLLMSYVDGIHASMPVDINMVATVGTNTLLYSTVANATAENQTLAQFLQASGISWATRGGIESNTANGDFGAFFGLSRGIEGAAVCAIWQNAELIVDPYSGASKGERAITLTSLYDFALPRPANFKRLKYVS